MKLDELKDYAISEYDLWLQRTEGRGVSWGEIAHIQGLKRKELNELLDELEHNKGEKDSK